MDPEGSAIVKPSAETNVFQDTNELAYYLHHHLHQQGATFLNKMSGPAGPETLTYKPDGNKLHSQSHGSSCLWVLYIESGVLYPKRLSFVNSNIN